MVESPDHGLVDLVIAYSPVRGRPSIALKLTKHVFEIL